MTTFQLYWLTRLDSLHELLAVLSGISAGLAVIGGIILYANGDIEGDEEQQAKAWPFAKRCGIVSLAAGLLMSLAPTTKELVAIYGISYLTSNKDAREIPAEALKVLNQKLKELSKDE